MIGLGLIPGRRAGLRRGLGLSLIHISSKSTFFSVSSFSYPKNVTVNAWATCTVIVPVMVVEYLENVTPVSPILAIPKYKSQALRECRLFLFESACFPPVSYTHLPFKMLMGYRQDTWEPKEPDTHSMVPPSATWARLVFKLYMFLDQFSMVE